MADVHSKNTRSYNMSRIKGKDTKPELLVRKYLHSKGFRYRLHSTSIIGKPDIVLPKYKTLIFVHGCFWHGHTGCKYATIPKTRTEWWMAKIQRNSLNDAKVTAQLVDNGWHVVQVWECELKPKTREETLIALVHRLESLNP
ncbi:very short patch repair endonuclease [Pontibacter toksunensis]|uniref:Very short patch repair endonuclease n=1 Tax=Pontibacter toksunensis TaxID=1332631 RepID=A0ABW6C0U1_9BACT